MSGGSRRPLSALTSNAKQMPQHVWQRARIEMVECCERRPPRRGEFIHSSTDSKSRTKQTELAPTRSLDLPLSLTSCVWAGWLALYIYTYGCLFKTSTARSKCNCLVRGICISVYVCVRVCVRVAIAAFAMVNISHYIQHYKLFCSIYNFQS